MSQPAPAWSSGAWGELRRRKVVQWTIAYGAGAWGFLQGLQYLSETFDWPAHLRQAAVVALLIGLPIVLVLAWYHGDRGVQRVTASELVILTLLFVLGGGIFWRYEHSRGAVPATASRPAQPAAPAAQADSRPSVAVLPFKNRSDEREDAYFVDGMHDDILTQLAKISSMKVISRTSVEQFRDTRLTTRDIGRSLGVTRILEGGVQRAGKRVRITVQLIDATNDSHLWAETYDRELTAANVFAIQSEIAAAVATALKAALTPADRARAKAIPTRNLDAWEAYQIGRQRMAKRSSESLADAVKWFETAIRRDPTFAAAYSALADAIMLQVDYAGGSLATSTARAEPLAAKALALDPTLADAVTTQASIAEARGDLAQAAIGYQRAIDLNPNYVTAYHWYSGVLTKLGRHEDAERFARKALEVDPLSGIVNINLGEKLENLGRLAEAQHYYGMAVDIDPSMPTPYVRIGWLYSMGLGRVDLGIPWTAKALELDPGNPGLLLSLGFQHLQLGGEHDFMAQRLFEQAVRQGFDGGDAALASLYVIRHEFGKARESASRAYAADPGNWLALSEMSFFDLLDGKPAVARARYAKAYPNLTGDDPPVVDVGDYPIAIDLAHVLQQLGETQRASLILDAANRAIRGRSPFGVDGTGIADVQILALRGRKHDALARLREAQKSGWNMGWRYFRDYDPALATIRGEPEFTAIFADIEQEMKRQRERLDARPKNAPLRLEPVPKR